MNYVKQMVYGPDPKEAFRKSKSLTRKNIRQLDREIQNISQLEKKTESLIKQSLKKKEVGNSKIYARELVKISKQKQRLTSSRATLQSINMQLDEQQQQLKLTHKLSQSTSIMHEINSLIRLPQISRTVRELSLELTKSGIITEMVDDSFDILDEDELDLDSETEEEVDKILQGFMAPETPEVVQVPHTAPVVEEPVLAPVEDDHEVNLMRERLKLLQG